MVFGTIMIAISSAFGSISANFNQTSTQSMEVGTFSCLMAVEDDYNLSNNSSDINFTANCRELLDNSIEAKDYSTYASGLSLVFLVVGFVTLFRSAIEYHKEGRFLSDIHFN